MTKRLTLSEPKVSSHVQLRYLERVLKYPYKMIVQNYQLMQEHELITYLDEVLNLPMAKLASTISRDCANILGNYKVTKDGITYVVKNHRVVTCYEVQS